MQNCPTAASQHLWRLCSRRQCMRRWGAATSPPPRAHSSCFDATCPSSGLLWLVSCLLALLCTRSAKHCLQSSHAESRPAGQTERQKSLRERTRFTIGVTLLYPQRALPLPTYSAHPLMCGLDRDVETGSWMGGLRAVPAGTILGSRDLQWPWAPLAPALPAKPAPLQPAPGVAGSQRTLGLAVHRQTARRQPGGEKGAWWYGCKDVEFIVWTVLCAV